MISINPYRKRGEAAHSKRSAKFDPDWIFARAFGVRRIPALFRFIGRRMAGRVTPCAPTFDIEHRLAEDCEPYLWVCHTWLVTSAAIASAEAAH